MKKLYGYTIANERLDKGFKACYRFSKYDSCLYDHSYYNTTLINEEANEFLKFLDDNHCLLPKFDKERICSDLTYLNIIRTNLLNAKGGIIGPMEILILGNNKCLFFYHCLMEEEVKDLFKNYKRDDITRNNNTEHNSNVAFTTNLLNKFSIIGPRSTQVNSKYNIF